MSTLNDLMYEYFSGKSWVPELIQAPILTRPADTTAYASGDLIANSTTAGSVTPLVFSGVADAGSIRKVRIRTNRSSSGTGVVFRVHIYRASPTVTNGDNGAWLSTQSANYLGSLDVVMDKQFSDGASGNGTPSSGSEINYNLPAETVALYGLIEARSPYTPASGETFSVALEII